MSKQFFILSLSLSSPHSINRHFHHQRVKSARDEMEFHNESPLPLNVSCRVTLVCLLSHRAQIVLETNEIRVRERERENSSKCNPPSGRLNVADLPPPYSLFLPLLPLAACSFIPSSLVSCILSSSPLLLSPLLLFSLFSPYPPLSLSRSLLLSPHSFIHSSLLCLDAAASQLCLYECESLALWVQMAVNP